MDIERALRNADPLGSRLDSLPSAAAEAIVQELVMNSTTQRVTTSPHTPDVRATRARRRRRRFTAGLITAGVIAVPGVAVAALGGMHSGFFGTGGEDVAGQEFLFSDAPDIRPVVQSLAEEFPLPPKADYSLLLNRYPTHDRTLVQRDGLAQQVQFFSLCNWYHAWQTGAASNRATAQSVINAAPGWKYWHGAKDDSTGRNGLDDLLRQIATETRAGNGHTLGQFVSANCTTDLAAP